MTFSKKSALVLSLAALTLAAAGCAPQYVQQPQLIQQVAYNLPGCPVDPNLMPSVFRGDFGTDALSRPLNQNGFPVDVNGQCLTSAPVTVVYRGIPSTPYISILTGRYGYLYNGGGLYYGGAPVSFGVHLWSQPGVTVNRTYVPPTQRTSTVTTISNYQAPRSYNTTTVPATGNVRPNSPAVNGAPANQTNYNRTDFKPTYSSGQSNINQPTGSYTTPSQVRQPSAAPQQPSSVAPQRSFSAPASSFRAPTRR